MAETKRDALAKALIPEQVVDGKRRAAAFLPKVAAPDK
jgi:hypothetical protein